MDINNKFGAANELFIKYGKLNGTIVILSKLLYRVTVAPIIKVYSRCSVAIKENRIVFTSNPDFSDNARGLFDYMIEHNYNEKYELVWLVKDKKKYDQYKAKNVHFINSTGRFSHSRSLAFYRYAFSAKYIFFTHTFNWKHKKNREKQHYINLWHGCGYKAAKGGSEEIQFDQVMVPGEIFIDTKQEFFQCDREKILPLGYPRYDLFTKDNKKAKHYLAKNVKKGNKAVLWMPTYRKSYRKSLNENTITGELNLPIVETFQELIKLDRYLEQCNVTLIVKKHYLQMEYDIDKSQLSNIIFIQEEDLKQADIELYELLGVTDGLLTDYSSVAIDYLLLDRPIGFTLDDYERYKESRGFVFEDPLRYMPGHHIYNMDELLGFIKDIAEDRDEYEAARLEVQKETHNKCECYSKRILDYYEIG